MIKLSLSKKIYIGLILVLAILAAINVFLPQGNYMSNIPEQELPAAKPIIALVNAAVILFLYGGLGFLGLNLSHCLNFADIWELRVSNRQRFLIPAIVGIAIGVFFIFVSVFFRHFFNSVIFPHPPFPVSIIASISAGIGEELIFRLFFISFWVWLISNVILKKRWKNQIFWVIAILSAIIFTIGHIPSVMLLFGFKSIGEVPFVLLIEVFILNGVLSIFAAYYFRKYGFLAAVGIHFWTDVVWHVIWGAL